MMDDNIPSFASAVAFHGHVCPGLAMGYRAAVCALETLDVRGGRDDIVVIAENNSCAVDAFQVVTHCTYGKGNLMVDNLGKQVYTLAKRPSGEAVRLAVRWQPPPETLEETTAWQQYSQGARSPEIVRLVQHRKEQKVEALFQAADAEIFEIRRLTIQLPERAQVFPTMTCQKCGDRVMAPKACKTADGRLFCIPCFEKQETKGA